MSEIQVLASGLLTTVQDLGREGFGAMGVSASGAADPVALRLGNRLVGNKESASGLEMTLLGGSFIFPQGGVIALAGSDFDATLDGARVQPWTSARVNAGQTLRVGSTRSGARCYLCVHGGIAVKDFLGSASTHLLSGLGGHEGRALRKGDVLQIGTASGEFRQRKISDQANQALMPRKTLRVTAGPQSESFSTESQRTFYETVYRVSEESNRMGLRMEGQPIAQNSKAEMITEGVALGAIQITAGGLPIILFVEQQTTGGYAKIANVISADLPSVGQLRPRDEVRFELVDFATAHGLLAEQKKLLSSKGTIVE